MRLWHSPLRRGAAGVVVLLAALPVVSAEATAAVSKPVAFHELRRLARPQSVAYASGDETNTPGDPMAPSRSAGPGAARNRLHRSALPGARSSLRAALVNLAADRYAVRQHASAEIRTALAARMARLVHAAGPEQRNRLTELLRFNANLSRWALACMALPSRQRQAMFAWGLKPKLLPLVAGAFSRRASRQAAAARRLARRSDPQVDWILARLLSSPRRLVYLSTMAALWTHRPTPALVEILWRFIITPSVFPPVADQNRVVRFHGRRITVPRLAMLNPWQRLQDSHYAEELLAHWKPPGVASLLTAYARRAAAHPAEPNLFSDPNMMWQAKNYVHLFMIFRPAAAVPFLLRLTALPPRNVVSTIFNRQPTYWDSRTTALYLLILAAGQDPRRYHFFHSPWYGGRWLVPAAADETKAITALTAWCRSHAVAPAATEPVGRPATAP